MKGFFLPFSPPVYYLLNIKYYFGAGALTRYLFFYFFLPCGRQAKKKDTSRGSGLKNRTAFKKMEFFYARQLPEATPN